MFVPAWSVLMLTAFISVAVQMDTTFGRSGLAPMVDARMPIWAQPSLIRVLPFDATAWALLALGSVAAIAAMLDHRRGLALWVVAACWFQVSVASPRMLGWQPDVLIFHGSVAAALLAGSRSRAAGRWLAYLLLAKLYLDASLTKLLEADGGVGSWLVGGFSRSFFEVAAIPGPLARTWHAILTPGMITVGAAIVAVGQLLAVVAIFVGPRARLAAFGFLTLFQLVLVTSTNFGALGWAALILGLTLVDDRFMAPRLVPGPGRTPGWSGVSARTGAAIVGVWALCQVVQTAVFVLDSGDSPLARLTQAWRLASRYAMFDDIPEQRYDWRFELVDEGGGTGRPLALPGQLDHEATRGRFLFAHHPRAAFMLWFASTMGERPNSEVIVEGFAHPPDEPERPVEMARRFAAWLCTRYADPGADPRIRLDVVRMRLTPLDQRRWWDTQLIARSEPVACSELVDRE